MLVDLIVVVVEVVVFVDREDIRFVALANMPRGYHAGPILEPLICGAFRAPQASKSRLEHVNPDSAFCNSPISSGKTLNPLASIRARALRAQFHGAKTD